MIFINEWLPNPIGADAKAEFIELYNNSDTPIALNGWVLKTTGKKTFSLNGHQIAPHGYLVLKKSETKLSLKNTNETISLYSPSGQLVDQSSFLGSAQNGKSLSRINYGVDTSDHFTWTDPTPGVGNKITLKTTLASNDYPANMALNRAGLGGLDLFLLTFGIGAFFAAIVVYFLKHDEKLQKLFFPRNYGIWP